jgi:GTP-sensing pleiotropic transcriptional regulator CodY
VSDTKIGKYLIDDLTEEQREKYKEYFPFRSEAKRKKDEKEGLFYNNYSQKLENVIETEANINREAKGMTLVDEKKTGIFQDGFRKR